MAIPFAVPASAYSVITHEQIVDLAWEDQLKPLLLVRFPTLTPDQLNEAHAYAYGGSVIQDMGYYPFGNRQIDAKSFWAAICRSTCLLLAET